MHNEAIETIEHKGFAIEVYPDYDHTHDDEGTGQLHCDSRDLYLGAIRKDGREVKAPVTLKYSVADILDILKTSHVFYGSYGSHSGQWLNAMKGELSPVVLEKLARAEYKKEHPTKKDKEDTPFGDFVSEVETCDVFDTDERHDVLLIVDNDIIGKQSAYDIGKNCWKYWDDIIRGNVYGFNIVDKDGDSIDGGSCWGFVGDFYDYRENKDGYMIQEAKGIIDSMDSVKYYREKYKAQIAHHAETIKTLSSKII